MNTRIRLLRHQHGMSLEQLASRTGLTKSYLSKVERGLSNPSISAALKIAGVLDVEVSRLFDARLADDQICVSRVDKRLRTTPGDQTIDILASEMPGKQMQPFVIAPPTSFSDGPQPHEHAGEEFFLVLAGTIEIEFPGRSETLSLGDAVYFRSGIPHRIRRVGDEPASALVVISKA